MITTHAEPAFIASDVAGSIGNGFSKLGIGKVVDIDFFRLVLWTPLPICVFELPDEFHFRGIDADDWLAFTQKRGGFSVDVGELGVTVLVPLAFVALALGLQTIVEVVEKIGDLEGLILCPWALSFSAKRLTL